MINYLYLKVAVLKIGAITGVVAGILLVVVLILFVVILAFTYYVRRKPYSSSYPITDKDLECKR